MYMKVATTTTNNTISFLFSFSNLFVYVMEFTRRYFVALNANRVCLNSNIQLPKFLE